MWDVLEPLRIALGDTTAFGLAVVLTAGDCRNTAPGRGCRCNSDLRPHYVATIAAGLASHPSYWVAGDLITSRIAEDAFDLADALMSTNRGSNHET